MRAWIWLILFGVVLATPFVLRRAIVRREAGEASTGAARLVVITPHNQDIRREFAIAFRAWHQKEYGEPVEIDFRVPGGANDVKRQLADVYRSWTGKDGKLDERFVPDIHVIWGGGGFYFENEIKPLGALQPIQLDPQTIGEAFPNLMLAGVPLYESTKDVKGNPTPKWIGVCLSAFGIVYNPDVYSKLGLPEPRQWHDLTDPRLFGQLALADPTHSGSAATTYMIVVERAMADEEEYLFAKRPELRDLKPTDRQGNPDYVAAISTGWKRGMAELVRIAANSRYFVDSGPMVPNDVGNGDAAAGIAIDFYGRVFQEVVGTGRCRFVMPTGATAVSPDPVGILAGVRGRELELATRFVRFMLTPQGQRLWILKPGVSDGPAARALRRAPIRLDVYRDRTGWTDDINPFDESRGFNQRADFETLFADTRPVWTAGWVDSRETLVDSYARILRLSDASRREELIAQLADLPITMQEVAAQRAERKRLESTGGNAEEWKARTRVEMTTRFRDHYKRVAESVAN
jgi:ABC-type Fe3+ transport system substrate-binding protein